MQRLSIGLLAASFACSSEGSHTPAGGHTAAAGDTSTGGHTAAAGDTSTGGRAAAAGDTSTGGRTTTSVPILDIALEECEEGTTCECSDGIDNDGDGLVDWHFDHGCSAQSDKTEGGVATGSLEGGWTVFEPEADTRITYASAEGDDRWSGLLPEPNETNDDGPKRTIEAAVDELRDGYPDWVLLRRGDVFDDGVILSVSGRSPSAPILVSSYGTSLVRPAVDNIRFDEVEHVAVAHLAIPSGSVRSLALASDVLIEGCYVDGTGYIAIDEIDSGMRSDWRIRRNIATTSEGPFYFQSIHGLLIEENVIYLTATSGADHGMYITRAGNEDVVTRGNLVYTGKPRGYGIMQRPGGLSEGNVVASVGWSAIRFGECNDQGGEGVASCYPPVEGIARGNLVTERRPEIGMAIDWAFDYTSAAEATDNLITDSDDSLSDDSGISAPGGAVLSGNVEYEAPWDETRPELTFLGLYNEKVGGAPSTEAFFEAAIQQQKFAFRSEYAAASVIAHAWQTLPDE